MSDNRRHAVRRAALAAAAAMLLGVSTRMALAQDEPVVIGQQQRLPTVGWSGTAGSVEAVGQYSHDSGSTAGEKNESTETLANELLTLSTNAYVVHPNFLDLSMQGQFGLTQDKFDSTDQNEKTNSTLYLWDVHGTFLREQPTNFTLYTDRNQETVDRAFGPSVRTLNTTYGALLSSNNKEIPSTFRLYRNEQTQTTLGGNEQFNLDQDVFEWHSQIRPTPNQTVTWDYRAEQTDQSSSTGPSDTSLGQAATLGHTIAFGGGKQHTLGSTLSYSDATGPFAIEQLRLDERLRMHHTPTFETEYEYIYDKQNSDQFDQTEQQATAEFRHWLYKSLITHGKVGYIQFDTDGGNSTTKDLSNTLDFDYTKLVPKGRLDATLSLGYDVRDSSGGSTSFPIIDQPFFFSNFQPIVIQGQTVLPNSLVITDSRGRIFTPGIDYTVVQRPDGVQVDRVIGGAIPDDSSVLVDYEIGPVPATQVRTSDFVISGRYSITEGILRGLSPYVRYGLINQTISGGGGFIQPDSVRDYLAGIEYDIWDLRLTAEYELYDSTLLPYNAYRLIAQLDHRISGDMVVGGTASYVSTDYTEEDRQTKILNANAHIDYYLTRELVTSAAASWVDLEDSSGATTTGLEESLEIHWKHRQLELWGRARNSNLNSNTSDSNFQFFEIGIRREF